MQPHPDPHVSKEISLGRLPVKRFKPNALKPPHKFFYKHLPLLEMRRKCEAVVSARANTFTTEPIYSCSTNVLCKIRKDNKKVYIPLEVALYAYSIEEGKLAPPYNVLINSGEIPVSYVNKAREHAENHKITIQYCQNDYPSCARKDYREIYKEMLDYTKDGERVVIVREPDDLEQTQGCIEWLIEKANEDADSQQLPGMSAWTVVTAVDLIAAMYNHVEINMLHRQEPKFALHYYIQTIYDASLFEYNDAIMCEYHTEEAHMTKWCAQSCAIRLFNNLESILEETYRMYNMAKNLPEQVAMLIDPARAKNQRELQSSSQDEPSVPAIEASQAAPEPAALPSTTGGSADGLPEPETVLAIEAPGQLNDIKPDCKPQPTDNAHLIEDQDTDELLTNDEPPVRTPKKKEPPLIIASGPNGLREYPPDIY